MQRLCHPTHDRNHTPEKSSPFNRLDRPHFGKDCLHAFFVGRKFIFWLIHLKLNKNSDECSNSTGKRFFIDLCIDIQPGYYAKPDDLQRFLYFLPQARIMTQSLRDRRSEILLYLALGATSLQYRSQAYRPDIRKIMQQGATEIQKLGDQDIMPRGAIYVFIQFLLW